MPPGFDTLSDHDFQNDLEEEIDFSDLREQYDVRMEEGLDTFCVGQIIVLGGCNTQGFLGHRRPPSRQFRTKTKTHQVSIEEVKFSGQNQRRCHLHANE